MLGCIASFVRTLAAFAFFTSLAMLDFTGCMSKPQLVIERRPAGFITRPDLGLPPSASAVLTLPKGLITKKLSQN